MIVLSIDSATECASCSIIKDDTLLGEINFNYKKQHSVILMPEIESLLKNTGLSINSIDGFVISKGPGSFTGLRIGIATVKGLSQGTKKPFIGVSSLDSLAYNVAYTDGIICPIIDALRENVYTALYRFEGENLIKIKDYFIVSIDDLITELNSMNEKVCFIGDALKKFKGKLQSSIKDVRFAPAHLNIVRSSSLGEVGLKLLKEGKSDNIYNFKPFYLRLSQAEREYINKNGEK